jgi:hypothetical protein
MGYGKETGGQYYGLVRVIVDQHVAGHGKRFRDANAYMMITMLITMKRSLQRPIIGISNVIEVFIIIIFYKKCC